LQKATRRGLWNQGFCPEFPELSSAARQIIMEVFKYKQRDLSD